MYDIPRSDWASALKGFTMRNAGRRTELEEDGPEVGAQHEESGWPLRGVAFDPRDNRIEIMVGDMASTERRLTRSIEAPSSLDLLKTPDGRDAVLRIRHGVGEQTLLRLIRAD